MELGTKLKNRFLWFDGDSTVEPDTIADMVLSGLKLKDGIFVSKLDEDINRFNSISDYQLAIKRANADFNYDWNIPEKYKELNVRKLLLSKLSNEVDNNLMLTDADIETRIARIDEELELYYKSNLNMLLRTAIYIIDTFREMNIVWGVGRGSACSSYILYLIGVHDIDSVYYELEITDFLRL